MHLRLNIERIRLLGGSSFTNSTQQRGTKGLMWGSRGVVAVKPASIALRNVPVVLYLMEDAVTQLLRQLLLQSKRLARQSSSCMHAAAAAAACRNSCRHRCCDCHRRNVAVDNNDAMRMSILVDILLLTERLF
jgi:hypothetical protein